MIPMSPGLSTLLFHTLICDLRTFAILHPHGKTKLNQHPFFLLIQEPVYSAADDGTEPYEEVQISPPSVYAELDRNRQDEATNDATYQKLLKRQHDSDYVIPADGSPSSVYAELDRKRQDETTNDGTYQKLLKRDSDYVIPAHTEAEPPYEEVGKIKTPPGYTELDNTKRVQDDSADYQKLIKK